MTREEIKTVVAELPPYISKSSQETIEQKRVIIRDQLKYLLTDPGYTNIFITCPGCSHRAVVWQMYRCLYCGVFYCRLCAQLHFGQRIPKWVETLE